MQPAIIDRGRGPEIEGSRITVYDVLDDTEGGATPEELAANWNLTVEHIHCALRYIEEHREEVDRDWAAIQDRHARQREESERLLAQRIAEKGHANPEMWERFQQLKAEREARREGDSGGHQHPGSNGVHPPAVDRPGVE